MTLKPSLSRSRRLIGWSFSRARAGLPLGLLLGLASVTSACGERDSFWNQESNLNYTWGFPSGFAALDRDARRVSFFTVDGELGVEAQHVPLDEDVVASAVAPPDSAGHRHLVLVTTPRRESLQQQSASTQGHITIIDPEEPSSATVLPLSRATTGLAVDPHGGWVVLYAGKDASSGFVVNPNELTLVALDPALLATGAAQVQPHTLRSFGGTPRRFTFTETLQVPAGPRRLLVVETEKDVAIVNLDRPSEDDLTIQLTNGGDARTLAPAGISVSDGEPDATDDARLAIRLANDRSIMLVQLGPNPGHDFGATINIVDVGGPPSDTAFVRTDGGTLALAALVPSRRAAVVVDPVTSVTVDVALPAAYDHMSLVTSAVNGPSGPRDPDVALLWSSTSGSVSFWALGRTVGKPYRSLENVALSGPVADVIDLPAPHVDRKLLASRSQGFFLLDLSARTVDPFVASTASTVLRPGTAGLWAWAFVPDSTSLARIDLDTKHPDVFPLAQPAREIFEVETRGVAGASHALVALHRVGNVSATIYDAAATGEGLNRRREVAGLFLRGQR